MRALKTVMEHLLLFRSKGLRFLTHSIGMKALIFITSSRFLSLMSSTLYSGAKKELCSAPLHIMTLSITKSRVFKEATIRSIEASV